MNIDTSNDNPVAYSNTSDTGEALTRSPLSNMLACHPEAVIRRINLTEINHKVITSKSTPPQIRQQILYIGNSKGVLQKSFPHKSINASFSITDMKNELTDSCGD